MKFLKSILCCMMLMLAVGSAYAAVDISLVGPTTEVTAGGASFTVTVRLTGPETLVTFEIPIGFDKSLIQLESGTSTQAGSLDATQIANANTNGSFKLVYLDMNLVGFAPGAAGTDVFTLTFKPTAGGSAVFTNPGTNIIADANGTSVVGTFTPVTVTITGGTCTTPPTVTSISPTSGAEGTDVTITGTNFATGDAVTFGATAATAVTVVDATSITCKAPAGTGAVNVTVTKTGCTPATSPTQFTYGVAPTCPVVNSISPASGVGGAIVTISGAGFGTAVTDMSVTFGGLPSQILSVNDTTISCRVPTLATTGLTDVVVTRTGCASVTKTGFFYYGTACPTVTTVAPATGAAGATVTITGQYFGTVLADIASVTFGSAAATVTAVTDTTITCTVPVGTGTVDVSVTKTGCAVATKAAAFAYAAACPTATGITPTTAAAGTSVVIAGTGFGTVAADLTVTFGTAAATVTAVTDTAITCTVPAGTGTVTVNVTKAGCAALAAGTFIYTVPGCPAITSIAPATAAAGASVVIAGTGFGTVATDITVTFGTATATVTALTDTALTCTVPAGTGTVTVTVAKITCAAATTTFTYGTAVTGLDVDGNGATEYLKDGMIILAYLFGFRGDAMVGGATKDFIGTGATITDPVAIATALDAMNLDVDGNGAETALTDGLLILRYMIPITDDAAFINGVIGTGATRTTAAAIRTFIDTLKGTVI